MAYSYGATDPIYSFRTLSEAARALCPVRIDKNPLGETYAHVEGVRIRITGDASLASVPPSSLGWLPKSNKQGESSHAPEMHIHARVVYIVDGDEVLIRRNGVRNGVIAEQYAGLFDSLDAALQPFVSELRGLESVDIPDTKELPVLGELIRDTCRKIAEDTAGQPKFLHGQRRLREWQIDELIGAYWKPFINGPWDAGITGSYALLKHRCGRGETPNVYAFDTLGHFGFRVRTPDHDWIIGEIYCPPERFSPTETPDPATLTNLDSPGDAWLAELGPVKFCIRKATSRT